MPGAAHLPGARLERLRPRVAETSSVKTANTASSDAVGSPSFQETPHVTPAVTAAKKSQQSAKALAELMRRGAAKNGSGAGSPPPQGVWMPGPPPAKPPGMEQRPRAPPPPPPPAPATAPVPAAAAPPPPAPAPAAPEPEPVASAAAAVAAAMGPPTPAVKPPAAAPKFPAPAPAAPPKAPAAAGAPRAAAPRPAPAARAPAAPAAPRAPAGPAAPRAPAGPAAAKAPAAPPTPAQAAARAPAAPPAPKAPAPAGPRPAAAPAAKAPAPAAPGPKPAAAPPPPPAAPPAAPKVNKEELRAKAKAAVEGHDPNETATGRHQWLFYTVPDKPVAGAEVVVYFNRAQSETLRVRPRILAQVGFNQWELTPDASKQIDVMPSSIRKDSSDYWFCRFQVPEDTYEINMVFTDGEGLYDNNFGKDFTFPVEAGITYEQWVALAEERAAKITAEKAAAEAEARRKIDEEKQIALRDVDKNKARERVDALRNQFKSWQEGGTNNFKVGEGAAMQLMWFTFPQNLHQGMTARLLYNNAVGPLARFSPIPEGQSLTLNAGFNNWQGKLAVPMTKAKDVPENPGDDWFEAEIKVPKDAVCVNFVINYHEHWDNNARKDYKIAVQLSEGVSPDTWAESFFEQYRKEEEMARLEKEAIERKKAEERAEKRRKAMEQVLAVQRRTVRHVMFTEPEVIRAGQEITIFYNPTDTSLAGSSDVYITGGWNRWTHKLTFGPLKMTPPEAPGATHFSAKVRAPLDAYKIDFVFSNVPGGDGTYDNRGGLDYHLPIEGGVGEEAKLHVVHVAVEMAPVAKVGGLGDVVTALGRAVQEQGHMVEVILPKYQFLNFSPLLGGMHFETEFDWGGTRIVVSRCQVEGLRVFFIEPRNGFFNTQTVYGRYDDEVRFDFFCKAALEFLLQTQRQPDIIHCHDWSTAHVAKSYWEDYHAYGLWKPKIMFTIHNLEYGQKKIGEAAFYCQKFTTVSPTYACEVGGHPAIAPNAHKFMGVRNGVDPEIWTPAENQFMPMPFTSANMEEGKRAARQRLRQRLNLTDWQDRMIVAVVSRLTPQKGMHLIKHAVFRTLDRGGQFVLLGSAPDPKVQADFDNFANDNRGEHAAFCFAYDEPLSHLIYAAADIILVPSMFEPCGLTQMIAMQYGSVPVVRHTGGLRDTIFDVDYDKARAAWEVYGSSDWQRDGIDATNGFAFTGTDGDALDYALNRAIDAWYNDRAWFRSLQRRVMEQDWSWNRPALDYIEVYFSAIKS